MQSEITVREVMNREYVGVSESDDLLETVELLLDEEAESAVVLRGSEPVGVMTERDVLQLLVDGPDPGEATVGDAMTGEVPTVAPESTVEVAADQMSTMASGRLVVTDGGKPVGILTERDLIATRTYQREEMTATPATGESSRANDAETTDSFQDQSICEACGTLTRDLASFNGQLLCPDCRAM